ncbi:MAG: ribbon-helix-helix domain-containing protein [Verrucomicrobiales bacterium]|jgi:hypothetical protein|nr:ribbon-helix-helix domain-containing protein [Verrucomicrobiales bacterium]
MKKRLYQKPLRDAVISIRVPLKLKERVFEVERRTHVTPGTMMQESLEAICHYVETNGEIRLPFQLVPVRELEKLQNHNQQ